MLIGIKYIHLVKCIWKLLLGKGIHFVWASCVNSVSRELPLRILPIHYETGVVKYTQIQYCDISSHKIDQHFLAIPFVNSLTLCRWNSNFISIILEQISQIKFISTSYKIVLTSMWGSGNGLVPWGNKPLPEVWIQPPYGIVRPQWVNGSTLLPALLPLSSANTKWHAYSGSTTRSVPGPCLNIKTVLSTYGDFHVKDKTAVRTSYL